MKKILINILLFISLITNCNSQVVFHKLYNYSDYFYDYGNSVIQTSDNGYIVVGGSLDDYDGIYILKLNEIGDTIWSIMHDFYPAGGEIATSIIQLANNDYSISGFAYDSTENASDGFLLRISNNGIIKWIKSIEGGFNDRHIMHKQTPDGGFIIGGYNYDSTFNSTQVFLIKTDSLGNVFWQKEYGEINYYNILKSIDLTPDGGFIMGGYYENPATNSNDMFLLKTDSLGNQQWKKYYSSTADEVRGYAITTLDKGFIIVGDKKMVDNTYDGYIIKTDSLGNQQWSKTIGELNLNEYFKVVRQLPDSSYIVAAGKPDLSGNPNGRMVWFLKFNKNGDTLWTKSYNYYGGTTHTYVEDLNLTNEGGFIATGYIINNSLPAKNDLWLLKTDSLGNTCTIDTVTWEGCSDLVTVVEMSGYGEAGSVFVYPNPAPDQITVNCEPKGRAEFILHDLTGVEVLRKLIQGNMHVELNGLSGGIYLYRVVMVGERISTGKLVIIR